jgi:sec-independent protein translocase protein TatB
MMKRMSFSETIFLFFLALIIFGPKKLPEIARQVGKYMNEFKRASNEFKAQIEQEIAHLEVENKQTILPPSPTPQGTTSRSLSAPPSDAATVNPAPSEENALAASAQAVGEDEPLFAAGSSATTEPAAGEITSHTSQESHV